jgi:hypothetical protein
MRKEKTTFQLVQYGAHGLLTFGELYGISEMTARHYADKVFDATEISLMVIVLLVIVCTQILLPDANKY